MDVTFFVDENLSRNLVEGLNQLGYLNIVHISNYFKQGENDEVWLEFVGEKGYAIITRDKNIRKNPKEKALLLKYHIVAFYIGGKNLGIREISRQIITAWDKMERIAQSQRNKRMAGAFIIRPGGGKIDEIPLT